MTTMTTTDVTKTLVIGLGSTGTRVCNNLIRRLEWEYGDAGKAPWVQFMAIETNNNEPAVELRERGDFFPIGLDARQYGQLLQSPQDHHKIRLEQWADMGTLKRLKDTEGGAGNIRMVGRLTFMLDPNYTKIKRALMDRLVSLRSLQASDALETRGSLPDGSNPQLRFSAGGEIRIFVVGTLCGGTGSGLLPDFGYFVRSMPLRETEKIIGILTLPHENLTTTTTPTAERLKKNAYMALVELNHYHQATAQNMPDITYIDGSVAQLGQNPYDLPYLIAPSSPTKRGETELNELVADRIFMNVVSPEADPFSRAVDAPMPDRDHHAHVFSTFGLSVVEFPAAQITEAASKKLLAGALTRWHAFKGERVSDLTRTIGVDWDSLVSALLQRDMAEWQAEVNKAANTEVGQVKPDFTRLDRALAELRGKVAPDGALNDQLRSHRDQVVETIYRRFADHATQALRDRTYGPQVLAAELAHLIATLDDLHAAARANTAVAQAEAGETWLKVEQAVASLKAELKRKSLINPNRAGIEGAQRTLRSAISEFTKLQITSAVHSSVQTHHTYGTVDFGVAERLQRLLKIVQTNLTQLDGRITALRNRLNSEVEAKSAEMSPINGLVLFEPRTTVRDEYQRALLEGRQSSVEHLDNIEARWHETLISGWTDLAPVIVPPTSQLSGTWINQPFDPRGDHLLPADTLQSLLREAARPFSTLLARENVLERLFRDRQTNPAVDTSVRDAAEKARPFLGLNKARATEGNRSPILERQALFTPSQTNPAAEDTFTHAVSAVFSPTNTVYLKSPDPTRALFLEEYFRFPLRGLDQVLGAHGLQAAECRDFPTFHTRRDVMWYGLSRREAQLLDDATEALIVGVILGELVVKDGLVIDWTPQGFGDRDFRRLPASLPEAARMLAMGELDADSYTLTGALTVLQSRIEAHWKRHDRSPTEAADTLVDELQQKLADFYRYGRAGQIAGWGDETWAGQQLTKFTAKHTPLYNAYMAKYAPPAARINSLSFRKDQSGPWGGVAPKDGLYCRECGGELGETVQDAARNGWRCQVNPAHYYGN